MPDLWGDTLSNSQMGLFPIGWQFYHGFLIYTQPNIWIHVGKCTEQVSSFLWAFPKLFPLFFNHNGTDFSCFSQRVTSTLEVLLTGSPKAFRRISQHILIYTWAIPPHFLESSVFLHIKINRQRKIYKPSEILILITLYPTVQFLAETELVRQSL